MNECFRWKERNCRERERLNMEVEQGASMMATANIVLGAEEQLHVSVGQDCAALSAALVQLKGECMKFLGDYLIRKNTPLEEPDEVLEESLSGDDDDDDEEEEQEQEMEEEKRKARN